MINFIVKNKKEFLVLLLIVIFFTALHIPGSSLLYHQDEYKWALYAETLPAGSIPHSPLGESIYRKLGPIIGYDNFRLIPSVFGVLNLILIFILSKIIFDRKSAIWIAFIFAISFYSLLASLMVDTDGALMPFFFLLMAVFYYKWKEFDFTFITKWFPLVFMAAILGFLIKESFVIAIAAFALDFAVSGGVFKDKKKLFRYSIAGVVGIIGLAAVLFLSKFIFPFFKLEWVLNDWSRFFEFSGRGWLQTFIQFAKAIMYLSPLLIVPTFFVDREIIRKTRPFLLFVAVGLVFYLLLFDFSAGALDRYFQFLIVPLSIISGAVISKIFNTIKLKIYTKYILAVSFSGALIFLFQFFNHSVPALYPKSEWINRVISLKWNFLFPFTGGSGPAGFYISFLFIALIWIFTTFLALLTWRSVSFKKFAILGILILGLLYNVVFIEEYLFGKINGSPYGLFAEAGEFIAKNDEINKVVVYNDIGGYEIRNMGKYERRLYAAPMFEKIHSKSFKDFDGHILYINIPPIWENSFYSEFIASCNNIYERKDRYITAKILDCGE